MSAEPHRVEPAAAEAAPARGTAALPLVRRWPQEARVAVLMITDLTALFGAVSIAYLTWARPIRDQSPGLYLDLAPLLLLFIAGYSAAGLYPGFGLGPVETLRRLSLVTGFGFLVLASFSFAFKLPYLYSRVTFFIALVFSLVALPVARAAVLTAARRWTWWPEPALLVAEGPGLARMLEVLRAAPFVGYQPAAILGSDGQGEAGEGLAVVSGPGASAAVAATGIRVALVDADGPRDPHLVDELQRHFRRVVLLRPIDELPVEGVQVRNFGGALALEVTSQLLRRRNRLVKRAVDVVVGSAGLAVAAPVIAAAAVAVKLASRGPAFFVQERAGLDGRTIRVVKIRTMHADAERRLADHLARDPELARQWRDRMKLEDDPRLIPGLGPLLRRFSLDELPQLATVVSGSMSLVGPRPFPEYHVARFPEQFQRLRERVRPGVTGLWQVTVRSGGTLAEQQAYDSYYIRNWSLWLDLYVLGRTLGAVITGRGAY